MKHIIHRAITETLLVEIRRRIRRHKNWTVEQTDGETFGFGFGTDERVLVLTTLRNNDCFQFLVDDSPDVTIGDLGHRDFFKRTAFAMISSVDEHLFQFFRYWDKLDQSLFNQAQELVAAAKSKAEKDRLKFCCAAAREPIEAVVTDLGHKRCWLLLLDTIESLLSGRDSGKVRNLATKQVQRQLLPVMEPMLTTWDYSRSPANSETHHQRHLSVLGSSYCRGLRFDTMLKAYGV